MTFIQSPTKMTRNAMPFTRTKTGAEGLASSIAPGLALVDPNLGQAGSLSAQAVLAGQTYSDLEVSITEEDRALWCFMKPQARPSFTPQLLIDLTNVQRTIKNLLVTGPAPFDYVVLGSRSQGVFNLGGDLTLFAEKIRQRDRDGLQKYARACVAVGYANHTGYDNGAMTIALIQGDALGGGFESALSCDTLIAERHAKFGLPEILFNLYPGMGAYSFLSRRVGMLKAEEIILGGRTYTAEEMLAIGAIDMVVEQGEGEQAVRAYIARNRSRQLALSAVHKVRRRVNPVSLEELNDITDLWVDTALRLSEQDLRRMCRIATAQDRFRSRRLVDRVPSVDGDKAAAF
ncbi:crotonase/enoyl-CoA hydratase family protein [Acidocella sp.]|uniref:crotonase/enoyl-CoA hydratase family protein n=1 Tax=Acidocella sp. TaxID=50710 RepID=UPI002F3EBB22